MEFNGLFSLFAWSLTHEDEDDEPIMEKLVRAESVSESLLTKVNVEIAGEA